MSPLRPCQAKYVHLPMPLVGHTVDNGFGYALLFINHGDTERGNFRLLIVNCRLGNFLKSDLFNSTILNLKSKMYFSSTPGKRDGRGKMVTEWGRKDYREDYKSFN